ncbi:hypothetical protein E4U17_007710 [Claviceps sp. LM77 group G4]|nr:hypothetical protein E4U17_007710 [Claviceps sp. LM77 group G4]KAG6055855.1 hypothetical protein E4U33_007777 [Claviceps sp. LM78 group G4]KAG6069585.1 hypothetical protein E4U16_007598 [Claviceps sp. LM84 group G4]
MRAFSLLTFLLPFVAAKDHKQCNCMSWTKETGWIHNEGLTHYVCFEKYPVNAHYDDKSKLCVASDGYVIDGETWENDCKDSGITDGYYPFGTDDKPNFSEKIMKIGAATGDC